MFDKSKIRLGCIVYIHAGDCIPKDATGLGIVRKIDDYIHVEDRHGNLWEFLDDGMLLIFSPCTDHLSTDSQDI
jgi:hypothetical protein